MEITHRRKLYLSSLGMSLESAASIELIAHPFHLTRILAGADSQGYIREGEVKGRVNDVFLRSHLKIEKLGLFMNNFLKWGHQKKSQK